MKKIYLPVILLIILIFSIDFIIYTNALKEIKRLRFVNSTLFTVITEYKKAYDEFEQIYNEDLKACYSLISDCQHAHNADCYVDGGYNCE